MRKVLEFFLYPRLEIQLDSEQVVLRGSARHAQDVRLDGRVVFSNKTAAEILWVKIFLTGRCLVQMTPPDQKGWKVNQAGTFYREESVLYTATRDAALSCSSLEAGDHVWPFSFLIKGGDIETLKGMDSARYAWRLKAWVARSAVVQDLKLVMPINVVRTYDPTSTTLYQLQAVDEVWPEKIQYSFTTPCRGVVFGSIIPITMVFTPLLKGLKIKSVETSLIEETRWRYRTDPFPMASKTLDQLTSTILTDTYNVVSDEFALGDEYTITRKLQLPRNLQECKLSLAPALSETLQLPHPVVSVKHKLKFEVNLENPDGHLSVLRVHMDIVIFQAPNQKFNKEFELLNSGAISMASDPNIITSEFHTPPFYGEHTSDETLNAQDISDSNMTTPTGLLSSRASISNFQEQSNSRLPSASTLRTRLSNLLISNSHRSGSESAASIHSPPRGLQESVPEETSLEVLSQVPSYNTAAHQSEPRADSHAGLPTYDEATVTMVH